MTSDDDFELRGGEYHCTNSDCDWWVPEGMEYLAHDHDCDEWAEKENTDEADIDAMLESGPTDERLEELMTEVEREVIDERMEDIEDEEKRGDIAELIERIDELLEETPGEAEAEEMATRNKDESA